MRIPTKVKIGGKIYMVHITEAMKNGTVNVSAEVDYNDLVIRIKPQAADKMEADLLHEVVHAILSNLGYYDHDEKKVEEMASALHAFIKDNEEVFKE